MARVGRSERMRPASILTIQERNKASQEAHDGEVRTSWVGQCSGMRPEGPEGRLRPGLHDSGDDPAVLADLAVADESQLLVGRQGTVEKEAGRNRTRGLGISLYLAAAETCDQFERPFERRRRDALAPVPLPTKLQAIRQSGKVVRLSS